MNPFSSFSYFTEHSIKMKDFNDLVTFSTAVDNIPLMGSTTRIDKALRLAQNELFAPENGARGKDVPKILIQLTDGKQTSAVDAEDPGKVADELRAMGVIVVVIGIGITMDCCTHICACFFISTSNLSWAYK